MKRPTKRQIEALCKRISDAEDAMEQALARAYPVGMEVRCFIMYRQQNPSVGDVISHPGGRHAYVRLRLRVGKGEVRNVPAENIL